jgi:hypothetical protein
VTVSPTRRGGKSCAQGPNSRSDLFGHEELGLAAVVSLGGKNDLVKTSRVRAVALFAGAVLATPVLAACGGDEPAAEDQPTQVSSTPVESSPTTTSPTPTPSPTLRPLSRFEDTPQVKVARKWAIGAARSVTANDKTMRRIAPFVTPTGRTRMQGYFGEDMGQEYPGPVPFTPVAVRDTGGAARVPMCMWTFGFTVDPKTKRPTEARRIEAGAFVMVKQAGKWRIDDMVYADHDCKKVVVKGRAF